MQERKKDGNSREAVWNSELGQSEFIMFKGTTGRNFEVCLQITGWLSAQQAPPMDTYYY
jgi:hypothetical protein